MEFIGCDGSWTVTEQGGFTCNGQLQAVTLEELRDSQIPQLTAVQKGQLVTDFIGFFVLIFVLIRLRRLA